MKLSPRQKKAVRKMSRHSGGALWWRVGTGKTRMTYAFFATIAKKIKRPSYHFLVVCRRAAFQDWEDEIERLGLNWRCVQVESEAELHGFHRKTGKINIYVMSHGKLAAMRDYLTDFAPMFDGVAYDEGFLYKNPQSEHCKTANKVSEMIGRAIILSGSIMTAKNLEDVYGQLYAINKHSVLAETLTEFRTKYLFGVKISAHSEARRYVATKGATRRIAKAIQPYVSINLKRSNKREIRESIRTVKCNSRQARLFRELRRDCRTTLNGHELELKTIPTLAIKCQQISDGYLVIPPLKNKFGTVLREGKRIKFHSNKMDYLIELVASLVVQTQQKMVIWCAFQYSCKLVLQALQKAIPILRRHIFVMHGSKPFDLEGWKERGLVAICTVGSGSSVNHFRNVPNAIYYSHDYKWLNMQQSKGRTDREDSEHDVCYYYFLQTEGSLDAEIYRAVQASRKKEHDLILLTGARKWLRAKS